MYALSLYIIVNMSKRGCKTLSIKVKQEIINAVKKGEKKKDVAIKYKIAPSTLTSIIKKSECYLNLPSNSKQMRHKSCEFPELEKALVAWWMQCRASHVPVGGALMRTKAKQFAERLGLTDFKVSDGWFEKFKNRHNIRFRKICGESAEVDDNVCEQWFEELKTLIVNYDAKDIFNADETGLFYKCLPDRAYSLKGENCHGGKRSKERVTLLLGANMDGTEKLKPLMIGKSLKPRCFKNIKTFPLDYRGNKKAWMTGILFNEWLTNLNNKMRAQNRKILLFIDNCPAHNIKDKFTNIDVKFLPANTTSKLQPLDKGIIYNFKSLYRKEVVMQMVDAIDNGTEFKLSLYSAMVISDKAWRSVNKTTIKNCFRACGFTKDVNALVVASDELVNMQDWERIPQDPNHPITLNEFIHLDDELATTGLWTDLDFLSNEIDDENSEPDIPVISNKRAKNGMKDVRDFLIQSEVDDSVFDVVLKLESIVNDLCKKKVVQTHIDSYFY